MITIYLLVCLVALSSLPTGETTNSCPRSYDVTSTILGSCYMIGNVAMTWFDAATFCMSTGGHLVDITSLEELGFLREVLGRKGDDVTKSAWTGGNDIAKQGSWMWSRFNQPLDGDFWDKGNSQPTAGNQHCVMLYKPSGYKVHDAECNNMLCIPLCEYRKGD